jgi:hypothetical protein
MWPWWRGIRLRSVCAFGGWKGTGRMERRCPSTIYMEFATSGPTVCICALPLQGAKLRMRVSEGIRQCHSDIELLLIAAMLCLVIESGTSTCRRYVALQALVAGPFPFPSLLCKGVQACFGSKEGCISSRPADPLPLLQPLNKPRFRPPETAACRLQKTNLRWKTPNVLPAAETTMTAQAVMAHAPRPLGRRRSPGASHFPQSTQAPLFISSPQAPIPSSSYDTTRPSNTTLTTPIC